jgi:histidinol phosphatase-like PHP family hydrolase
VRVERPGWQARASVETHCCDPLPGAARQADRAAGPGAPALSPVAILLHCRRGHSPAPSARLRGTPVIVDHDAHVHTTLSACCHDEALTPANAIALAAEIGLRTIGFANHMWDAAVPGASDWYAPQDLAHVLEIRRQIPADTRGLRVLVGCETEYCGDGRVGISPAAAEKLDFVLVPASHFHMPGVTVPAPLRRPRDVAELLVQRFREVVALGLATGIPHPFVALGYEDWSQEVLSLIPDEELLACFGAAAEAGVSVEMHVDMFSGTGAPRPYPDETFLRVMSLAKRAGCFFHFTSDAHELAGIRRVSRLEPYARQVGITPDDILPLFRPHAQGRPASDGGLP